MKFVMPRDRTVESTLGHVIEFKKNVPVYVPQALWALVQEKGAIPEEELPDDPDAPKVIEPEGEERLELLVGACKELATRNNRDDFGANGAPSIKALADMLGFKPSAQERDTAWAKAQVGDDK